MIKQLPVLRTARLELQPLSADETRTCVARLLAPAPDDVIVYALRDPNDGIIGKVGLHPRGGVSAELSYWLARPFRGRGLMTEAVNAAVSWAHQDWRRSVLAAGHFVDDAASAAVLIKAGFLYTGVIEPCWSIANRATTPMRRMVRLA
jgi:RimJ/RimL family protein N-acetyltransferase